MTTSVFGYFLFEHSSRNIFSANIFKKFYSCNDETFPADRLYCHHHRRRRRYDEYFNQLVTKPHTENT